MVDLAVAYGEGPVTAAALAGNQGISEAYLERLLRILRNKGIIETSRGVAGGYALSCPPDSLSVERVLAALEGSTAVVDCVGTSSGACKNACTCAARPLFLTLQAKINAVLTETMVNDLAKDYIEQKRRIEHAKSLS